ncbi:MAG: pirin family protein [Gammaproteobacteria bacterium]|nr:pirin family protein [Gammaproteobacteria bacterium]
MITQYKYDDLGHANHGWLKSKHHFSFASYYNPKRMGFGKLRVINDDWVEPGAGFAPHPHRNMEIISFVRSGEITHQDSEGNKGTTHAGEVQTMSAGTGIIHSEYNYSDSPLTFYQIWIETQSTGIKPRWQAKEFPTDFSEHLPLLVSGYAEDEAEVLPINQQARIYGGKVKREVTLTHPIQNQAYILASDGEFELHNGDTSILMKKGDGAEVTDLANLNITTKSDSEIVVIDVPA